MNKNRVMRILIVDDEGAIRTLIKLFLIGLGTFDFLEADNGSEGLSLVSKFKPDLIIADIMMPVMDGVSFISELRKLPDQTQRETPVIVLTGGTNELRERSYKAGATYVLEKPLDRRLLISVLNTIFRK